MSRGRTRSNITPSLFPFLAVLVCTMGALIVLLLMMVQQARHVARHLQAAPPADALPTDKSDDDAARREREQQKAEYEWQADVYRQQREQLLRSLADKRLELSHLEDHIRRLEDRLTELRTQAQAREDLRSGQVQQREQLQQQRAALEQALAAAREELDRARRDAAGQAPTFTVIPYDGPNGTRRRPIYIECTDQAITIQPEQIVLRPEDFLGPGGPGNPLDAALRTIREAWARQQPDHSQGEPYPLVIVRPDGAVAYHAARTALQSWDDEFGYELVEGETKLEYPPEDATLRPLVQRAIADARERQRALMANMPSRYRDVAQLLDGGSSSFRLTSDGGGSGGNSPLTTAGGGSGASQFSAAATDTGEPSQGAGDYGNNGRTGTDSGAAGTPAAGHSTRDGEPLTVDGTASPPGAANSSAAGAGDSGNQFSQQAGDSGANGAGGNAAGGTASGAGGGAATFSAGFASASGGSRGGDWGLRGKQPGATGYTVPVRVVCGSDRLVILPQVDESRQPREFPNQGRVAEAIDPFVAGLWEHLERWGQPPLGGYWQPVLHVYVQPGAEQQFAELQTVMNGSGIQVVRHYR